MISLTALMATYLVSVSGDQTLRVWDRETYEQVGDPFAYTDREITDIGFLPGSHQFAAASVMDRSRCGHWMCYTAVAEGLDRTQRCGMGCAPSLQAVITGLPPAQTVLYGSGIWLQNPSFDRVLTARLWRTLYLGIQSG